MDGIKTTHKGIHEDQCGRFFFCFVMGYNDRRLYVKVYTDESGKMFETPEEAFLCKQRTKTKKIKNNELIVSEWRMKLAEEKYKQLIEEEKRVKAGMHRRYKKHEKLTLRDQKIRKCREILYPIYNKILHKYGYKEDFYIL